MRTMFFLNTAKLNKNILKVNIRFGDEDEYGMMHNN